MSLIKKKQESVENQKNEEQLELNTELADALIKPVLKIIDDSFSYIKYETTKTSKENLLKKLGI